MPPKRKVGAEGLEKDSKSTKHDSWTQFPTSNVYRLIEPGPVLLVTTGSLEKQTHNIMTIGFHMMMRHDSPLIGITLGPWDASFNTLRKQRECVLAIPSIEIAEKVVDIGNCSSSDSTTSKCERFGLSAVPAERVQAPLVGGPHIIANIECVVEDTAFVDKYSMWVLKAVSAWKSSEDGTMFHHRGQGVMVADGEVVNLKDRMVKWQEFMD